VRKGKQRAHAYTSTGVCVYPHVSTHVQRNHKVIHSVPNSVAFLGTQTWGTFLEKN